MLSHSFNFSWLFMLNNLFYFWIYEGLWKRDHVFTYCLISNNIHSLCQNWKTWKIFEQQQKLLTWKAKRHFIILYEYEGIFYAYWQCIQASNLIAHVNSFSAHLIELYGALSSDWNWNDVLYAWNKKLAHPLFKFMQNDTSTTDEREKKAIRPRQSWRETETTNISPEYIYESNANRIHQEFQGKRILTRVILQAVVNIFFFFLSYSYVVLNGRECVRNGALCCTAIKLKNLHIIKSLSE